MTQEESQPPIKKRGFAAMSPERQRAIAQQGGQAAHQQGKAHTWNAETAKTAGTKGGKASSKSRKKPLKEDDQAPTT